MSGHRTGPNKRNGLVSALWLLAIPLIFSGSETIHAQWSDSFEGGEPRWQLVESDCQADLTEHSISLLMPHGGRTSEMFELSCTHGTLALLAYPIEPSVVLDEFQPRLWTRCSSGRIQLGVRVIFPFAAHPTTGGRLTTILWGDLYADTGRWQDLRVTQLSELLARQTVELRQRFGAKINLDGAYVDSLVLNAYTGPGRYRVQVDDMDLRGMIPLAATGNPPPANWREAWRWRDTPPTAEQRYWAAPNQAPVWLQHRGESLSWIKSLGFSGIITNKVPSEKGLAEIRGADLGVIAPPPPYAVQVAEDLLPALQGWLIGAALDTRQANHARDQVRTIAKFPASLRKPLVAEALEDYFMYSRIADELIIPYPISTSAGDAAEKLRWLEDRLLTSQQRGEGWVSLNVGMNPTLAQQIQVAHKVLNDSSTSLNSNADPLGLRHQVVAAVMAGAKGFFFRTFAPIQGQRGDEDIYVAAIRWINNDLRLWGPWIVGGQSVPPPVLSDSNWKAAAWRIDQSHLIVSQTLSPNCQFALPATQATPVEFSYTLPSSGQQVFRTTDGTLERLETQRTPAGIRWSVDSPAPVESFLVTSTPLVMRFARQRLSESAAQNAADQLAISSHNLGLASRVVAARFPSAENTVQRRVAEPYFRQLDLAQRTLDQGWQALRTQQPTAATRLMYKAGDIAQSILRESHEVAIGNLASPQSSPFVVHPATLELHWQLARSCERSQWTNAALPGGELSSLGNLLDSGWSQQRRLEDKVDLRVELVPATNNDSSGLRLAAYAKPAEETIQGGYAGASLRVRSAGIPVQAGQLIRISANAKILRGNPSGETGLLVYDNQIGPSLGQLLSGQTGEVHPIELYRFIVEDGEFRLLAECRGECDIVLDSIRASTIRPARNKSQYFTSPVEALPLQSTMVPRPKSGVTNK